MENRPQMPSESIDIAAIEKITHRQLPPECHMNVFKIFEVLDELENGQCHSDWLARLCSTRLGMLSETGDLARKLGEKGCDVRWTNKGVTLKPRGCKMGVPAINRKSLRFRMAHHEEGGLDFAPNHNFGVLTCLMEATKIAFVHNRDTAARICLEEMMSQGVNPTFCPTTENWFDPNDKLGSVMKKVSSTYE